MKHLILALLAATFSLSVTAQKNNPDNSVTTQQSTAVGSSRSNIKNNITIYQEGGKNDKEQACKFTTDEKGAKHTATKQEQQKCMSGTSKAGAAGIAVSDPGGPDRSAPKK